MIYKNNVLDKYFWLLSNTLLGSGREKNSLNFDPKKEKSDI